MQKFEQALKLVIKQFGKDIIIQDILTNALSDFQAFSDTKEIREIVSSCNRSGFLQRLNRLSKSSSLFKTKNWKYEETKKCLNKYISIVARDSKSSNKTTEEILYLFAYNVIDGFEKYIHTQQLTPTSVQTTNQSRSTVEQYSYKDLLLNLLELIFLVSGNAIFLLFEIMEWWMFFTYILFCVLQYVFITLTGYHLLSNRRIAKGIAAGIFIGSTINYIMPWLLMNTEIAAFYRLLIYSSYIDTDRYFEVYNYLNVYEGGLIVSICIIWMFISTITLLSSICNKEPSYLFKKLRDYKRTVAIGILLSQIILVLCLSPAINNYLISKEYIKSNIIELFIVDKQLDDAIAKRAVETRQLSFNDIILGKSISDCIESDKLKCDYDNGDELFPRIQKFYTRQQFSDSEVRLRITCLDSVIYQIKVDYEYNFDRASLKELYQKKYGEANKGTLCGLSLNDNNLDIKRSYSWEFKNCAIVIPYYEYRFYLDNGVYYIDKQLLKKAYAYIADCKKKEEKRKAQEKRKKEIRDSIEQVRMEREMEREQQNREQEQLQSI